MSPTPDIPGPLGRRPRRWRVFWIRRIAPLSALLSEILPRLFDVLLAGGLLVILAPLLALRAVVSLKQTGRVLERTSAVGRFRQPIERLAFASPHIGKSWPLLVNILRSDLAFAGPRLLTPAEAEQVPVEDAVRFSVRPGLISPHALRRRVGIAYEAEGASDREFVYGETLKGNAGLVARSAMGSLLGGKATQATPPRLDFFGIVIVNGTMQEAVDWIVTRAHTGAQALLAFVNPDCLNIAYRNAAYKQVLMNAERVLPDGIGLHIGCRMLGAALVANVNGTDLFPRLCERLVQEHLSLFLLGGQVGVADAVAETMGQRYPGLRVAGTQHGYFSAEDEDAVIARINDSGAAVLLVAFGAPKQELWLARQRPHLRPAVLMGVGGLFDFYSGRIPRAPIWMRELGLEWMWRLIQEPGRLWRRYLIGNPLFLYRVWRQGRGELSDARG